MPEGEPSLPAAPAAEQPRAMPAALAAWRGLIPGTMLTIIKLAPEGHEVTRYPGVVSEHDASTGWVTARAVWTHHEVDIDGVRFRPDDLIDEYFSPTEWFNAFEVWHGEDGSQGWYINVTHPTRLDTAGPQPTLIWHDLYLDIVVRPDGSWIVRDEDELAASGLARTDPALHARIIATKDRILGQLEAGTGPFARR